MFALLPFVMTLNLVDCRLNLFPHQMLLKFQMVLSISKSRTSPSPSSAPLGAGAASAASSSASSSPDGSETSDAEYLSLRVDSMCLDLAVSTYGLAVQLGLKGIRIVDKFHMGQFL